MKRIKPYLLLLIILCVGFLLRTYGVNWDQGHHLHPDERFLTRISTALKVPSSFLDYLDPTISPLNPYNAKNSFFVYGTLPLTFNKLLVVALRRDHYYGTNLVGRVVSAGFDTLTIFLVFSIGLLLEKRYDLNSGVKFLAAGFYAITVLPIQLSHFFANDSFLCFFMTASLYCVLQYHDKKKWWYVILSALFFGCALGTKVNAIFIFPLLFFFLVWENLRKRRWLVILLFLGVTYIALRVADPRFFADGNMLNPRINPQFLENIKRLRVLGSKDTTYPPSVQWFNQPPVWFSLRNLVRYGLGPAYFLFLLIGMYVAIRMRKLELLVLLAWVLLFFLYQSTRFVKSLRYFIFLYPLFAVFTALGFYQITKIKAKMIRILLLVCALFTILAWPVSFLSIYSRNHSRIEASYWIHANIPENSFLVEEHWDDALPVGFSDIQNRHYQLKQMPVFEPDNEKKIKEVEDILAQADYIVFTSNRGYGAIPQLPERFPYMIRFYEDLFAGRGEFEKIKEFTSYPTLNLGFTKIVLKDDYADETFTVYDHPKVTIFKRKAQKPEQDLSQF